METLLYINHREGIAQIFLNGFGPDDEHINHLLWDNGLNRAFEILCLTARFGGAIKTVY